jgi:hypothetical protein
MATPAKQTRTKAQRDADRADRASKRDADRAAGVEQQRVVLPPFAPPVQETLISAPNREPREPAVTDTEAMINGLEEGADKTFITAEELYGPQPGGLTAEQVQDPTGKAREIETTSVK